MTHTPAVKILYISASSRHAGSVSRALGAEILAGFPGARIIERDLTVGMPHVDEIWVNSRFTPLAERTVAQNDSMTLSDTLVAEVQAADVIIISTSTYNFSLPAALKAWIDQIARPGLTFKYTPDGPVGLLEGKRVIVMRASTSTPVDADNDFSTPYLRYILSFMGMNDVQFIGTTGRHLSPDEAIAATKAEIDALTAPSKA